MADIDPEPRAPPGRRSTQAAPARGARPPQKIIDCSEAGGRAQRRRAVRALPGEVVVFASEMAVGGGLLVDRPVQLELLAERAGPQVEDLVDRPRDLGAADAIALGAEGLDH